MGVEDGSIHTVTTYGEAMDSGDKATNKAMSIAFKYAAFQAFCIPTEQTAIDADAEVHQGAQLTPDDILKNFTGMASTAPMADLKCEFAKAYKSLSGTPQQAIAKDVYDIRKSEIEEA